MKIMVQGTSSSCGKSTIVTAMCRVFYNDGFKVCPFKSMNLSSNAFITDDGLQIAWAQAVQAFAAKIEPKEYMNPILLKPLGNYTSSVFYMGKELGKMSADEYNNFKSTIKEKLKEIFESIHSRYDIVVIEGAGSPAEINLKKNDIVNMGMAKIANSNVILVADIDRGGAFASIYGTYMLLDEDEKARIKGIIINKFHGKISLLKDGIKELERLINVPVIGVIPYIDLKIIDEDSLSMSTFKRKESDKLKENKVVIAVIDFPKIKNFNDYSPFMFEEDTTLIFSSDSKDLKYADMIIIPDTEDVIVSLDWLKRKNIWNTIKKFNGLVFGIGTGYALMYQKILFSNLQTTKIYEGLGLFDGTFKMNSKTFTGEVKRVTGNAFDCKINGYLPENQSYEKDGQINSPFAIVHFEESPNRKIVDGETKNEKYFGTNLYGVFNSQELRAFLLNKIRSKKGLNKKDSTMYNEALQNEIEKLARIFKENVNVEYIYKIMEERV